MTYIDAIDYWSDYGADVRHDPSLQPSWEPQLPQNQDEADALAAITDAPEPEEPEWLKEALANAPF